jgi:hypothetical protein
MKMFVALVIALPLGAAPCFAQVTPNNPPGSDSMSSRATHPDSTSMSAPEASSRSDASTDSGARPSEIQTRRSEAPNQTNRRPDQQK